MYLETETGEKVNFLRTDRGSKYMGSSFQKQPKSKGIHYKRTNPETL